MNSFPLLEDNVRDTRFAFRQLSRPASPRPRFCHWLWALERLTPNPGFQIDNGPQQKLVKLTLHPNRPQLPRVRLPQKSLKGSTANVSD
jgi:hypothetical protein